jgi:signal transduction histidine kinase
LTQAVDEIVWAVNPRHDTLDGLISYLCPFAQNYLAVAGIQCRLDVPAALQPVRLTADARHNLFLAVKEALNNIVKHAGAHEVRLRLTQQPGAFTLVIEDDGQGFDVATCSGSTGSGGQGLQNLASRLGAIGGHCSIQSDAGRGTRVELSVGSA